MIGAGEMSKEPEIIYLTNREKLQDKITEIEKRGQTNENRIFIITPSKLAEFLDDKIPDDKLPKEVLNTVVYLVQKRPKLIARILEGKIELT